MSAAGGMANAVSGAKIHKTFTSDKGVVTRALDNVSLEVSRGALTATALAGLDAGTLGSALDEAGLVAAITCSRAGANPPRRAEVDAHLR